MSNNYNKLVRDKVPEIIDADGKTAKIRILNNEEYVEELIKKLRSKYEKLSEARDVKALADIEDVLFALAEALNIPPSDIAQVMAKKAVNKGGYKKRIFLEFVE